MPTIKSNHSHLFWRGVGGEAVCFIWFMFIIASSQVHRTIRVDLRYLCSLIIKQLSRVRLLIRVLRVQSVCAILQQQSPQGYSFDLRYSCSLKRSSSRAALGFSFICRINQYSPFDWRQVQSDIQIVRTLYWKYI